jgi:hypothetical protein
LGLIWLNLLSLEYRRTRQPCVRKKDAEALLTQNRRSDGACHASPDNDHVGEITLDTVDWDNQVAPLELSQLC